MFIQIDYIFFSVVLINFIATSLACKFAYKSVCNNKNFFIDNIYLFAFALNNVLLFVVNNIIIFLLLWMISLFLALKLISCHHQDDKDKYVVKLIKLARLEFCFTAVFAKIALLLLMLFFNCYFITDLSNSLAYKDSILFILATSFLLLAVLMQSSLLFLGRFIRASGSLPVYVLAVLQIIHLNTGVFIVMRFSDIILSSYLLPLFLIVIYLISMLVRLRQLVQSNYKLWLFDYSIRSICLILLQFSCGLVAAAVGYIFWNSASTMYNLFNSANILQNNYSKKQKQVFITAELITSRLSALVLSSVCTYMFVLMHNIDIFAGQTDILLALFVFMAGFKILLPNIIANKYYNIIGSLIMLIGIIVIYHYALLFFETVYQPINLYNVNNFSFVHLLLIIITIPWLFIIAMLRKGKTNFAKQIYVQLLNWSQVKKY